MPFTPNQAPNGAWQPFMSLPKTYQINILCRAGGELAAFGVSFDEEAVVLFEDVEITPAQNTPFDLADALKTALEAANPELSITLVSGATAEATATLYVRFSTAAPLADLAPVVIDSSGYLAGGDMQVTPARRV